MYRNGIAQNQCSAFVFQQEFDHARGKQMCFTVFEAFVKLSSTCFLSAAHEGPFGTRFKNVSCAQLH